MSPTIIPETPIRAPEGSVLLYDPEHASLTYGPNDNIRFGPKAGLADGFGIVDEEDPYLPGLFVAYPAIVVVERADEHFFCDDGHPEVEFKSRAQYRAHRRTKQHQPDAAEEPTPAPKPAPKRAAGKR
jgi:hypothetical protein